VISGVAPLAPLAAGAGTMARNRRIWMRARACNYDAIVDTQADPICLIGGGGRRHAMTRQYPQRAASLFYDVRHRVARPACDP
jgi:hypothetical protein